VAKRGARDLELSLEHRAWIVENLLAGVAERRLVEGLAAQVPRARAAREVAAIARSPLLPVCAQLARRARRLELVAAIGRSHARGAPERTQVERRTTPSADEFFRDYWAAHRPVVLTDATARWPALRKWTPAFFRRRFGGETIEITANREADPFYDMNFRAHRRRMRMDRFIDRVLAAGTSNDLYMVSNNHTMRRPRFRALLGDIRPPRDLFEPLTPGATSLWIGPAGTITPLHHDTTNILFAQLHGRKRIELVSPQETALLLDPVHGFYSPVDLDGLAAAPHPALQQLLVKQVVLAPGDALYIPAGWWHRVTSLDVSISFSLLGFRRPNDFDWYRPGHV
jgi:hypothetical protein